MNSQPMPYSKARLTDSYRSSSGSMESSTDSKEIESGDSHKVWVAAMSDCQKDNLGLSLPTSPEITDERSISLDMAEDMRQILSAFKNKTFGETELDEAFQIKNGFDYLAVLKGDSRSVRISKVCVF